MKTFSLCQAFICHQVDKIEKYLWQQGSSHPVKAVKFSLKFKKAKISKHPVKNTAFVIIVSSITRWVCSLSANMIRLPWEIRLLSRIRSVIWTSIIVSFHLNLTLCFLVDIQNVSSMTYLIEKDIMNDSRYQKGSAEHILFNKAIDVFAP